MCIVCQNIINYCKNNNKKYRIIFFIVYYFFDFCVVLSNMILQSLENNKLCMLSYCFDKLMNKYQYVYKIKKGEFFME